MKFRYLILFPVLFLAGQALAQTGSPLPRYMTAEEYSQLPQLTVPGDAPLSGITSPPAIPVRTMAEWEELQALLVTWNSPVEWLPILVNIIAAAKDECRVIVNCGSQGLIDEAKNALTTAGVDFSSNVEFVVVPNNSIWVRDYGPNCVYANGVDSLYMVDWIYNRPSRKKDDSLATTIAPYFGVPLYRTMLAPTDLVNTGGNFMSDGMGTAFGSKLVLNENALGNPYGVSVKTEAQINSIFHDYMGIERFIKMTTLPYDGIHHIDMHMKLLDEETLLIGKYPVGTSDGPQIEANLTYVLNNFKTSFGTPFKVVRVPMPDFYENNLYPPYAGQGALYPTYANAVFVNKTIIMPIYNHALDAGAIDTLEKYLPGYRVFPIDCREIIDAGGAVHCITKEIGVNDPLRIVHQGLPCMDNTAWSGGYPVWANITHRSGIQSATIHYATDPAGPWQTVNLPVYPLDDTVWTHKGFIPNQPANSTVYYYIEATALNGKTITRPITAPEGYWSFCVEETTGTEDAAGATLQEIYPNPASAMTVIPVSSSARTTGNIRIFNALGQLVETVFSGEFPAGLSNHFIDAGQYVSGTYFVELQTGSQTVVKKLIVR
ncbi:MAG: agmatine deiminase family protein [Saprospiraceae bacterium]|nr:agmatine deiminase family protein [Saprospiraceae bacterium]